VQVDTLQTLVRKPVWRIKDLAEAIGVDPSQSSRIIAGLTQIGLVASSKSSDDRRSADVSATQSGRHWADEITKRLDMLSGMVIQRLPPDHRYLLAELLEEYLEAMAEVRDQLKREAKIPAG
jgi:DNA-binding MarR family transcriptional regulator